MTKNLPSHDLPRSELVLSTVLRLIDLSASAPAPGPLVGRAMPWILAATGADRALLASPVSGQWAVLAESGRSGPLPVDLLADAIDRGSAVEHRPFLAIPVPSATRRDADVLLVESARSERAAHELAAALVLALGQVDARCRQDRRIGRLETVLEVAQLWYRTHDMETLLAEMARAATRLLEADRASVFLWDRPTKTLVGRPALGVDGGELRIADDAGIVGQVVRGAAPCRVDRADTRAPIDRRVDTRLDYVTENLLCVPLVSPDGSVFGAFEVLNKRDADFSEEDEQTLTDLASHAAIALGNTQQREDLLRTREALVAEASAGVEWIGSSRAIEALRATVDRIADADLPLLILGENGTGKEVVSRLVHYGSCRRARPFVAVNCAALAESLLESELFGHEKGAFTDARESRPGKFELAAGGTLLLDEIGEMSRAGQAKLLRVLEEKRVVRVGGSTAIETDVRVLAATNRDLARAVRDGQFREDLYYRLNGVTLELPPLRDRGDDILELADHFLRGYCRDARRPVPRFTASARKRLRLHAWPGNVRELRNLMERLAYLHPGDSIDADDLAFVLSPGAGHGSEIAANQPLGEATRLFQIGYIESAIRSVDSNMSDAADRLGLHRSNLYRKMRQLGMAVGDDGASPPAP